MTIQSKVPPAATGSDGPPAAGQRRPPSGPLGTLEPGLRFTTLGRTMTEADLVAFGTLTGDLHPQHVDATFAAASPFGARLAHGMLVLSYAVGLVPFDPRRVVALRRVADVVFKRPVLLGDTIHVEGRIEGVTPIDHEVAVVATTCRVLNQEQLTAARLRVEVLVRRDPEPYDGDAGDGEDGDSEHGRVVVPL